MIRCGDCREVLREFDSDSLDACGTDPPYGFHFLGKKWDIEVPRRETWEEVLRVLKPGAFLAAFGGPRTWHRLAVEIEDAGFEIVDTLFWFYGQGYPKSVRVGEAIDKARVDSDEIRRVCRFLRDAIEGKSSVVAVAERFGCNRRLVEHWSARDTDSQPSVPTIPQWLELKAMLSFGDEMDEDVRRLNLRKGDLGDAWKNAEVVGEHKGDPGGFTSKRMTARDKTIRSLSDKARKWEGFGTRLKPACEPIILAMKPRSGTIVENVLEHGTGVLHIDACRIAGGPSPSVERRKGKATGRPGERSPDRVINRTTPETYSAQRSGEALGRFPTNVLLSDEPEVLSLLPEDAGGESTARFFSRIAYVPKAGRAERDFGLVGMPVSREGTSSTDNSPRNVKRCEECGRSIPAGSSEACPRCGSARVSFSPAAMDGTGRDRSGSNTVNDHPTLKPVELMTWLVRLLCPPGGTVLDPFCGSGTTGVAAKNEGMKFVGIELDPKFARIARERIRVARAQGDMFR